MKAKKPLMLLLLLAMVMSLFSIPSFAAEGTAASDSVIRVTLPTALTVVDNRDGTYACSSAELKNTGGANVVVSDVSAKAAGEWSLVDWSKTSQYTVVDQNYVSMSLYGKGINNAGTITGATLPSLEGTGGAETNVYDTADLDYDFWMSPQTQSLNGTQVASVVVTVSMDGNGGLKGISVTTPPDKVDYIIGEDFDPTGMVVTAEYFDGSTADVTNKVVLSDNTDLVKEQTAVPVSYTEGNRTAITHADITVDNINVTVDNPTSATVTEPAYGWYPGENTITVAVASNSSLAPAIVYEDTSGNLTRVYGTETGTVKTYQYVINASDGDIVHVLAKGDVDGNGYTSIADMTRISQYLAGTYTISDLRKFGADVSRDGVVDEYDMELINRYLVGLTTFNWDVEGTDPYTPPQVNVNVINYNSDVTLTTAFNKPMIWFEGTNSFRISVSKKSSIGGVYHIDGSGNITMLRPTDLDPDEYGDFSTYTDVEVTNIADGDTIVITRRGDMDGNGYVSVVDMSCISQYAAGTYTPTGDYAWLNGDVDGDCNVNQEDSNLVSSYLAGQYKMKWCPTDVDHSATVVINDLSGGKATITEPASGWWRNANNIFTVASTNPCGVYLTNGNGKTTTLTCFESDASNTYDFSVSALTSGTNTITIVVKGDVDLSGDVSVFDMSSITQYLAGNAELSDVQKLAADVSRDGTIDALDVELISRFKAGLTTFDWDVSSRDPYTPPLVNVNVLNYNPAVTLSSTYHQTMHWFEGTNNFRIDVSNTNSVGGVYHIDSSGNITMLRPTYLDEGNTYDEVTVTGIADGDTIVITRRGDMDGNDFVSISDMTRINQYVNGLYTPTGDYAWLNGDVDGDCNANQEDMSLINRYLSGLYKMKWCPTDVDYTATVVINDLTGGNATVTEPTIGWWRNGASNTFSVTCTSPCGVYLTTGEGDTSWLVGSATDDPNTYKFTTDALTAGTNTIYVVPKGDVDLNGYASGSDMTRINQYLAGLYEFSDVQKLAADIDRCGEVDYADMDLINLYLAGQATFNWDVDGESAILAPTGAISGMTFNNSLCPSATLTAPSSGWTCGKNTFTITSDTTFTLLFGNYLFKPTSVSGNTYTYTQCLYSGCNIAVYQKGDINLDGSVTSDDVTLLRQYLDGTTSLNTLKTDIADMNSDGTVDEVDYTLLDAMLPKVNAILYDDGELVFQIGSDLTTGRTGSVVCDDVNALAVTSASNLPWYSNRASITTVTFNCEVAPTSTAHWFNGFSKLTTINNIERLNTINVKSMVSMFNGCSALTALDLSSFDTSNVTAMNHMFYNCRSLVSLNVSSFNTEKVTTMQSMFWDCSKLSELDVSSFDTHNVTTMYGMFAYVTGVTTLDLSSFDTSNVKNMQLMFYGFGGSKLTTIYVSDMFVTAQVTNSGNMFTGHTKLVGGNGTKYNSSYVDKTYARIDTAETPGYFTASANTLALRNGAPITVTIVNDVEGAFVTEPEDGWFNGQNTFTVTSETPVSVYRIGSDNEPILLYGTALDDTTTEYTAEMTDGDTIHVTEYVAPVAIDVDIVSEVEGVVVTAPEAGWFTGANTFTVTSETPVFVLHMDEYDDYELLEGTVVDDLTASYTVNLVEGDYIYIVAAEDEPVQPETISVTVTNDVDGAVVTEPEAGWVAGENTFMVTSAAEYSVYHISADCEPIELTGTVIDDETTEFTVELADGDTIQIAPVEEQPAETPAEEQPAEAPAEEQPAETPVEEQPVETPDEATDSTPSEEPADVTDEETTDTTSDEGSTEPSDEETVEAPAEAPAEEPAAEEPAAEVPSTDTTEVPAEVSAAEEPAGE